MKRTVRFLPLPLIMLAASSVFATPLPDFDAATAVAAPPRQVLRSDTSLGGIASIGTVTSIDPQRGTPSFVWVAPPPDAGLSSRMMTAAPEDIARDFVEQNME